MPQPVRTAANSAISANDNKPNDVEHHGSRRQARAAPNEVSDELFAAMRTHWSEDQMVGIVGVISLFGFMNRWNDSMATPLEAEPTENGERFLAKRGWSDARHVRAGAVP